MNEFTHLENRAIRYICVKNKFNLKKSTFLPVTSWESVNVQEGLWMWSLNNWERGKENILGIWDLMLYENNENQLEHKMTNNEFWRAKEVCSLWRQIKT